MNVYNVRVAVVDLVPADSEADAIDHIRSKLRQAGFDVYEDTPDAGGPTAFLSDDQEHWKSVLIEEPSRWPSAT